MKRMKLCLYWQNEEKFVSSEVNFPRIAPRDGRIISVREKCVDGAIGLSGAKVGQTRAAAAW